MVVVGRSGEKTQAVAKELDADYFASDFAELAGAAQGGERITLEVSRHQKDYLREVSTGPTA